MEDKSSKSRSHLVAVPRRTLGSADQASCPASRGYHSRSQSRTEPKSRTPASLRTDFEFPKATARGHDGLGHQHDRARLSQSCKPNCPLVRALSFLVVSIASRARTSSRDFVAKTCLLKETA